MEVDIILLSKNRFTGVIPSRIFQSPRLSLLDLSRNNFSGELSENIGDAKAIQVLVLSRNNFSGPIPKSVANMSQLILLDLSRNGFSGDTFPVFDPNGALYYVDLSFNELSGDIPVSFCRGTVVLSLGGNKFSGNFPENLTDMESLEYLDLQDNNITGYFPEFFSKMSTLQLLSLRNNSLHGSVPPNSFSNQSNLRILDLSNNNLAGGIPLVLGNLKGMSGTHISYSYSAVLLKTGTNNHLMVDWVEAKISLVNLIVAEISSYSRLFTFTVEINDFMVKWKKAIQGISSRSQHIYSLLDLSNNRFSGEIPISLGNLKGLKLLDISNNRLSGYIPQSFGELESIETLDLSNNNISSTIPQSFGKLEQLSVLDVSNNKLSGKIPRSTQMDTMNNLSFANNSGLCGTQISVNCSNDGPSPNDAHEDDDDNDDDDVEKEPWFLWTGVWIGYPLGLISSVLTTFLGAYFVIPLYSL